MEIHRKLAIKIIDKFEGLLNKYDIKLPSNDREGNEDEAAIYGKDYFDLEDEITDILDKFALSKNVKNNIYNDSKFRLCNNHSFKEIKEKDIDELDYEKAFDLATVENERYSVSAYLGVYDGKFDLTYSIHGKNDFDKVFDNDSSEEIDMKKIDNIEELEKIMKVKLAEYFIENREYIENYSNKLDELEIIEIEEDEEETLP